METEEPTDYVLNAETGQLGTVLTQPAKPTQYTTPLIINGQYTTLDTYPRTEEDDAFAQDG